MGALSHPPWLARSYDAQLANPLGLLPLSTGRGIRFSTLHAGGRLVGVMGPHPMTRTGRDEERPPRYAGDSGLKGDRPEPEEGEGEGGRSKSRDRARGQG